MAKLGQDNAPFFADGKAYRDTDMSVRNPTEDRTTAYGDRVVDRGVRVAEAGKQTVKTQAAPPQKASPAPVPVVEIMLIDPKELMTNELRTKSLPAVEKDLARLYASASGKAAIGKGQGMSFSVTFRSTDTSKKERGDFHPLQYPIYVLNAHTSDAKTVDEIIGVMKDHKIRKRFDDARAGWEDKNVEGLGIPVLGVPISKVGFIKADNLYKRRGSWVTDFRNIILHELGHMFGLNHGDNVMDRAIVLADDSLYYSEGQQVKIRTHLWAMAQQIPAWKQARAQKN